MASGNLSQRIQETLENEIVSGKVLPGTRLEEPDLAERFKASRTPVREALHKLAAAGLIEIVPRKGAIVPRPDYSSLLEMFEVMAELEASCARFATRRLTERDKDAITESLKHCLGAAEEGRADDYYHWNEVFHQAIYAASHNRYLQDQCNALLSRLRPFRRLQLRIPNRIETSAREHELLVDAIFNNKPDDAASLACDHVLIQGRGFNDFAAILRSQLG